MSKKILYVDMDNVIVDFKTGIQRLSLDQRAAHVAIHGQNEDGEPNDADDIPGIFSLMDPMPDAIESVVTLSGAFDLYVLSTSPWNNPTAWSDKLLWIKRHFGSEEQSPLYKRLILSHHKNLNDGHFLVDDRLKHGATDFGMRPHSEHIHFGQGQFPNWKAVVPYLLDRA
jgi:5'-nucleotidase